MRFKTEEVAPYTHTYCAFNKHTGEFYGGFDCLFEATDFAKTQPRRHPQQGAFSYTLKREGTQSHERFVGRVFDGVDVPRWTRGWGRSIYVTEYHPAPDWVILDDLGDLVPEAEVKRAAAHRFHSHDREQRYARYRLKGRRLTRLKGAGDKVKASCEQVPCKWRLGETDNRIRGYFRGPQTTNEKRQNVAHVDEYGETLVRGRRRRLPSNWDDRPVAIYESENSWKHHSKRRKQWKPK